ncbi:TM2 domain-containing protein [Microbacterium sp. NPDC055910]|uniref:TM2 domain-containing protein n=1 Tax=Microbacterium sp. NPDC055910 TaxID=3345659 RepID=UPI0035D69D19
MSNDAPAATPGWYSVASGGKRYWNGYEWTTDVIGAPTPEAEWAALSPTLPAPTVVIPPQQLPPAYVQPQAGSFAQPAGWYPGPTGLLQWWDGRSWGPFAPQTAQPQKEVGIAYLFFFLLGGFAAHRFYLGRIGSAIALLCIWWAGWFLVGVAVGVPLLIAGGIWLLVDLFVLPSMVRDENARRLEPR